MILDTRITWLPHINNVRKMASQRMGMLGPLLNKNSDPSVRNGVPLYKQLNPVMDYACPAWMFAAYTHVWMIQLLKFECLYLATGAPWYVSNSQIHEDMGVLLFTNYIRALRALIQS